MNPSRPDVIFDCMVFLQALSRPDGPAAQVLQLVERNSVTLHISKATLRELRRVLTYPDIRHANPQVTDDVVEAFVSRVSFRGVLLREVPRAFEYPRDPGDEPYLDLAAAVQADFLITWDNDLLSLAISFSNEAKQLRQRIPSLRVMNPVDFLLAMRGMPDQTR